MSTQANPVTNAAPPAGAGGGDFDSFAEATLGIDSVSAQPEEAQGAAANGGEAAAATPAAAGNADGKEATAGGAAKPGEEKVAAEGTQADEWAVDQAILDKLLADPAHGAFAKTLHEKYVKAVESAKVWGPEAQEARALVPGGLPELKETVEIARSARAEAADFASGDPARQKTALASIAEEHPEQFAAALPLYMELAAQKNPQAHASYMKQELTRALEGDGVVDALGALFTAAKANNGEGDEKAFGEAFGKLSQWFEKAGFTAAAATAKPGAKAAEKAVDPELAKAQAKLKEYEERDNRAKVDNFKTWWEPTSQAISKDVREDAKTRLEDFLPKNIETNFRNFTMNQLLDQVEQQLVEQLRTDAGHQEKLAAVLKEDAWSKNGEGARTQYVNLSVGRAKQLLPHIIKKVMEPATKAAVASASAKNATEKTNADKSKNDVTGSGGGTRPKAWTVKDVRAGGALAGKTEEEILEM